MISLTKDNRMLGYGLLSHDPGIFHFVTTRSGGYSEGNYASFNCSPYSGDDALCIQRNTELLRSSCPDSMHELVIPYQTHGTEVRVIDSAYAEAVETERFDMLHGVDALVTACTGYCLCISTADCIPLLLYDVRNRVVAAVHAGWRGTVNRIVYKTLEVMNESFGTEGKNVLACIGPGISLESFEVGNEVYEAFCKAGFYMPHISSRSSDVGKWHIDLWEANRLQLLDFGISSGNIELSRICTYINNDQFFSARRLGIQSGRILSGIMLKP